MTYKVDKWAGYNVCKGCDFSRVDDAESIGTFYCIKETHCHRGHMSRYFIRGPHGELPHNCYTCEYSRNVIHMNATGRKRQITAVKCFQPQINAKFPGFIQTPVSADKDCEHWEERIHFQDDDEVEEGQTLSENPIKEEEE